MKRKFILIMNNKGIYNLVDLRNHFEYNKAVELLKSGTLLRWLKANNFNREFAKVMKLEPKKTIDSEKLYAIFDVKKNQSEIEKFTEMDRAKKRIKKVLDDTFDYMLQHEKSYTKVINGVKGIIKLYYSDPYRSKDKDQFENFFEDLFEEIFKQKVDNHPLIFLTILASKTFNKPSGLFKDEEGKLKNKYSKLLDVLPAPEQLNDKELRSNMNSGFSENGNASNIKAVPFLKVYKTNYEKRFNKIANGSEVMIVYTINKKPSASPEYEIPVQDAETGEITSHEHFPIIEKVRGYKKELLIYMRIQK